MNIHGVSSAEGSNSVYGEEGASSSFPTEKLVDHDGDILNELPSEQDKIVQGDKTNFTEMNVSRSPVHFKEAHLKQLRAQCLVYLAFKRGLMPKKLHLDIALGNILSNEGSSSDAPQNVLSHQKENEQFLDDPSNIPDVSVSFQGINIAKENAGNLSGSVSTEEFQEKIPNFQSKRRNKRNKSGPSPDLKLSSSSSTIIRISSEDETQGPQ